MTGWPTSWPARLLAAAWASPVLVLGLLAALAFRVVQPASRLRWKGGALEVIAAGPFARWMNRRGWGAFTLAPAIFLWSADDALSRRLYYHERRHLAVTLVMGPLIIPTTLLFLLGFGYENSPSEVDARAHEPPVIS